jgi:hypothetical protein
VDQWLSSPIGVRTPRRLTPDSSLSAVATDSTSNLSDHGYAYSTSTIAVIIKRGWGDRRARTPAHVKVFKIYRDGDAYEAYLAPDHFKKHGCSDFRVEFAKDSRGRFACVRALPANSGSGIGRCRVAGIRPFRKRDKLSGAPPKCGETTNPPNHV